MKYLFLSFLLLSAHAHASVCNSIEECLDVRDEAYEQIKKLEQVQEPQFVRFQGLRNFSQARTTCETKGLRLPTIRELARYAQSRGALGILETQFVQEKLGGKAPEGYDLIKSYPLRKDDFYYNSKGFHLPEHEDFLAFIWSSELWNKPNYSSYVLAIKRTGEIYGLPQESSQNAQVWCVKKSVLK